MPKGKKSFTPNEIDRIRFLLRQKRNASRSKQKSIRSSMRKIGFYITDFDISQSGFEESDLDTLISSGSIHVSEKNMTSDPSYTINSVDDHRISQHVSNSESKSELIRGKYLPSEFTVLYIGESPPAGGTFFYFGNSNLYRCLFRAFLSVFPNISISTDGFLSQFQDMGCYLDDLCLTPVNQLSNSARLKSRVDGINPLAHRIRNRNPRAIITVMKAIVDDVQSAIKESDYNPSYVSTATFPAFNDDNKQKCIIQHADILQVLLNMGIINDPTT